MSAVIAWTCKRCGHHAEGLDIDEFVELEGSHKCKPVDELRRAVPYWRRRSEASQAVADWLEKVATTFVFAKSGERASALKVARATPWEEES